jgi:hypothetical protein
MASSVKARARGVFLDAEMPTCWRGGRISTIATMVPAARGGAMAPTRGGSRPPQRIEEDELRAAALPESPSRAPQCAWEPSPSAAGVRGSDAGRRDDLTSPALDPVPTSWARGSVEMDPDAAFGAP